MSQSYFILVWFMVCVTNRIKNGYPCTHVFLTCRGCFSNLAGCDELLIKLIWLSSRQMSLLCITFIYHIIQY